MAAVENKKLKTISTKHLVVQIILHAVLILIAIMVISPLLLLVFNSFKSNNEILNNPVALPSSFTLQYIVNAMQQINFWQSLGVTFIVTFCSVALLVLVSSFAAWGMTRAKSKLSDFMYLCFTAAMLIPFQSLVDSESACPSSCIMDFSRMSRFPWKSLRCWMARISLICFSKLSCR